MKVEIKKGRNGRVTIEIPNILANGKAPGARLVIWNYTLDNDNRFEEYTENGRKLLLALKKLKGVRSIDVSLRNSMEIYINSPNRVEAIESIRQTFAGWNP